MKTKELFDKERTMVNKSTFWADIRYALNILLPVLHILRLADGDKTYEMAGHIYFALHELDRYYEIGELVRIPKVWYLHSENQSLRNLQPSISSTTQIDTKTFQMLIYETNTAPT